MKINIVLPFIYRAGGVKLIIEYANRLTDLGHDIVVYYPLYPYNTQKGKVDIVDTLRRYYRLSRQLMSLKGNIEKFKKINFKISQVPFIADIFIRNADVSVATAWPTAFSVNKLSYSKGKKFYFVQDYENWESNVKHVDQSYKLPLYKISTCKYLSNLLHNKFGEKSEIIFNGIDLKVFYRETELNSAALNILFIDSGMKRKNSILAVKTILRLKEKYPYLKFRAFGHRKFHEMPDYIEFFKNPDDESIRALYAGSDIFLCTSIEEGYATPPAEAMACKCAVVTNRIGAVEEYSTNLKSAMHVEPGDEESFYDAICYLVDNPEKWKMISLNAYKDAVDILDCWEESTLKLEKLFLSALK